MSRRSRYISLIVAVFIVAIGLFVVVKSNTDSAAKATAGDNTAVSPPREETRISERIFIGCAVPNTTGSAARMVAGIRAEAVEQGAELILLDANNDSARQLSQVKKLIAQRVDTILIAAVDADAAASAVRLSGDAGIPVTALGTLINTDRPYYYAGPDDAESAALVSRYIINQIGGKGNVVIIEGCGEADSPLNGQSEIIEGIQGVLAEYPEVTVLARKSADHDREKASELMSSWLMALDEQIDGVIAHNDEMALGAIDALASIGLSGRLPVAGIGAVEDACVAVRDGKMAATVYYDAELEGRLGVQLALDALKGHAYARERRYVKTELVTKDNADEIIKLVYR